MKHSLILLSALLIVSSNPNAAFAQWVRMNIDSVFVTSFAAAGTDLYVSAALGHGPTSGIFRSTNGGDTWSQSGLNGMSTQSVVTAPNGSGGSNVFAGCYWSGVFISTDNGSTWTGAGIGQTYDDAYALAADSGGTGNTRLIVATANSIGNGHGVFLSTNNGTSWTNITNTISGTCVTPNCWVDALSVIDNTLFAGTVGRGVFLSTDNGTTWTPSNTGLTTLYVQTFATNGTDIFVGTWGNNGGVFRSTNGGATWIDISAGLTNSHVQALVAIGTNLFVGTEGGGVFLSTNNGTNWTQVNTGLTDFRIWSLAIVGPYLFAGSDRSGVWRRPLSEMITDVRDGRREHPARFALRQNYPNPFNPSTTISFDLPSKSFVSLTILDALGREVSALVAEDLTAGTYTRQWNPTSLASGIYFCRLRAGSFTQTRKLGLLK